MSNDFSANNILKDEITQSVLRVFGIHDASTDEQIDFLVRIGYAVENRVLLEIIKKIPADERPSFQKIIEKGAMEELVAFLNSHIENVDEFIGRAVEKEVTAIRDDMFREFEAANSIDVDIPEGGMALNS